MKDIGALLTTTGVVATLFAVFFAATAMYIQYRKNKHVKAVQPKEKENHHGSSPGSLVPFEEQGRLEVTEVKQNKYVPPAKKMDSNVSSKPVFKKYMPSGVDNATIDDSSEYIWE